MILKNRRGQTSFISQTKRHDIIPQQSNIPFNQILISIPKKNISKLIPRFPLSKYRGPGVLVILMEKRP